MIQEYDKNDVVRIPQQDEMISSDRVVKSPPPLQVSSPVSTGDVQQQMETINIMQTTQPGMVSPIELSPEQDATQPRMLNRFYGAIQRASGRDVSTEG